MVLRIETRPVWLNGKQQKEKDLRFAWIQYWWGGGQWLGVNSVAVGPDGVRWQRLSRIREG
jgi:hypothetical protein